MVGVMGESGEFGGMWGGLCPRASILRQPLVTSPPPPSTTNAIIDCQSLKATTNGTTGDKCLINSLLLPPENNDAIALSQSYGYMTIATDPDPTRPDPQTRPILIHHIPATSTSQNPKVSIQLPVRALESFATCFITVAA